MPPVRHYVNFAVGNEDPAVREGRVTLLVTRALWSRWGKFTSSRATRRLEWEFVPNGANHAVASQGAESASAAAARIAMGHGIAPAVDTKAVAVAAPVFEHPITAESEDGRFHNRLTLPHTGGDRFTVRAHKLDSNGLRTATVVDVGEVVTWRRIYYDFYAGGPACHGLYDRIVDRLREHYEGSFVELVENRKGDLPNSAVTTGAVDALFAHKAALTKSPNHLRLGLVEQYASTKSAVVEMPVVDTQALANAAARVTVEYDGGAHQWRFRLRLEQRSVFPAAVPTWRLRLSVARPAQAEAMVPQGHYAVVRVADDEATVTITDAGLNAALTVAALQPTGTAKLTFSYYQLVGGTSAGQNIALTRHPLFGVDGTDAADRLVLIAFLHEIGHSLGMVDIAVDTFYFDDHGGRGPHCSTAADQVALATNRWNEVPRNATISGNIYLPNVAGTGQCVMYHARWTNMCDAVFCANCVTTMKKMRINVRQ